MIWPPIMAWTSVIRYKGHRSFVAIDYGGIKNTSWIDLVSVLDGDIFIRVSYKDLKDPAKWLSGWVEVEEKVSHDFELETFIQPSSVYPSNDSGLPVPICLEKCRPWFE